jgi:hypothetical protein
MSAFKLNAGGPKRREYIRKKKRIMKEPEFSKAKKIRVQLDRRTVITLGSLDAFNAWKQRYPEAQIISNGN